MRQAGVQHPITGRIDRSPAGIGAGHQLGLRSIMRGVVGAVVCSVAVTSCRFGISSETSQQQDVVDGQAIATSPSDLGASSSQAATTTAATPAEQAALVVPTGFDARAAVLTKADGTACDLCLWIADTQTKRQQGLMGVTSLGGADGMAFVWQDPTSGGFWMKDTLLPLTIAFVADTAVVEVRSMVPCLEDPCPTTEPAGSYDLAVEFVPEAAERFGVATAQSIELLDQPCETAAPEP